MISPSKVGTLTRIAKAEGGMKKDGSISREWARRKLNDSKTSGAVKKKINFFLNFNQG